jgi:hypothetical protein
MLRVKQICGTKHSPGIVPYHVSTWHDKVARGLIPRGTKLGPKTTVWPIETVLAVARGEYLGDDVQQAPSAQPCPSAAESGGEPAGMNNMHTQSGRPRIKHGAPANAYCLPAADYGEPGSRIPRETAVESPE